MSDYEEPGIPRDVFEKYSTRITQLIREAEGAHQRELEQARRIEELSGQLKRLRDERDILINAREQEIISMQLQLQELRSDLDRVVKDRDNCERQRIEEQPANSRIKIERNALIDLIHKHEDDIRAHYPKAEYWKEDHELWDRVPREKP